MKLKAFLNRPQFKFAGLWYSLAWVKVIDDPRTVGYCEDSSKIIYLKDGEPIDETFKTMLHEMIHAMDHVYSIKLSHTQVRKLELAFAEFLIQNDIIK
jgi:hypothetical protein